MIYAGGVVFEAGIVRRAPDGSYVDVYRKLHILSPLPLSRVVLTGPRCWRFVRDSQPDPNCWRANLYDFAEDVRELVLERIRFDVFAEWTDPREWLGR